MPHSYQRSNRHTSNNMSFTITPEAYALTNTLSQLIDLSFLKAMGRLAEPENYPLTQNENSLESLLFQRISSLDQVHQEIAKNNFYAKKTKIDLLKSTIYKDVAAEGIIDQLSTATDIFENAKSLVSIKAEPFKRRISDPSILPARGYQFSTSVFNMHLKIDALTCWKETTTLSGGGADEIVLSSVIVNPDGYSYKKDPVLLGNDFDAGDFVHFNAGNYVSWDFKNNGSSFPKYCSCLFVLVEQDNGNLPEIVEKIFKKLKDFIVEAIGSVGPVWKLVSIAVDLLLDEIFKSFKECWEDDLFPTQIAELSIPSSDFYFSNGNGGLVETANNNSCFFYGHGGIYELNYSWQIERTYIIPDGGVFGPPVEPGLQGAIIYKNINFGGDSKLLSSGKHKFWGSSESRPGLFTADSFNNEIDSIKVGSGYIAYLYKSEDFTGEALVLYGENIAVFDDNWRDQISSIWIVPNSPH